MIVGGRSEGSGNRELAVALDLDASAVTTRLDVTRSRRMRAWNRRAFGRRLDPAAAGVNINKLKRDPSLGA
jgi:hypothetical protein